MVTPDDSVLLINLGGTVAAVTGPDGEALVVSESSDLQELLRSESAHPIRTKQLEPIPSSEMTLDVIIDVAREICAAVAEGSTRGVVVAQGTDTLEETAFALDVLLDVPIPVVVTGAMRQSDWVGADGPANLVQSIRAAASPLLAHAGVVVLMADEIHRAATVSKVHTSSVRAFASSSGPLGWISSETLVLEHQAERLAPPALWDRITAAVPRVPVYTVSVGDGAWAVEALTMGAPAGVVVQGFGGGHVTAATAARLGELTRQIPVVMTSRCGAGVVLAQPYWSAES